MVSPSPSPETFKDDNDDFDDDDDDDDEDEDASSPSDDEMIVWVTYPLSLVTKKGSSFGYESSHVHRERVSKWDFCQGECSYSLRDIVRILVSFLLFLF